MPTFSWHCSVTFGRDNAAASFRGTNHMAYQDITRGGHSGSLRAANATAQPASRLAAGPFEATVAKTEATLPDALITGMLVVYPVVATVVAVMVGLAVAGPVV